MQSRSNLNLNSSYCIRSMDIYRRSIRRTLISTFLLARYLLELVATVSEIDFLLEECMEISFREWNTRALQFLSVLYRARHSTSDEKFKSTFLRHGFQEEHLRPIKMKNAIKRLTSRYGFASAKAMY